MELVYIYGDSKSALVDVSMLDPALKKKSNSITHNFVEERVAMEEWLLAYINIKENLAGSLNKPLVGVNA